jgi:potassium large conductance calcium-activated channel subfamily M alpha protein 1
MQDKHLSDKSAILCSLNIKAMNFDDSIGLLGNNHAILPPGMAPIGTNYDKIHMKRSSIFGLNVPMITELRMSYEC